MQKVLSIIAVIMIFLFGMAYGEAEKDKKTTDRATEAAVWFLKGHEALSSGHYDEAITCYTKAKDSDPSFTNAYFFLGNTYLKKGMTDSAIYEYKKALALRPQAAAVYAKLGSAYLQKGMLAEAGYASKKALAIDPNDALAHFTLGNMYSKKGNNAVADDHLYRAGILYLQRGDVEGTVQAYECLKRTNSKELESKLYEKLYPGLKEKSTKPTVINE
jgi:Tfp pilus assembly protein PilF